MAHCSSALCALSLYRKLSLYSKCSLLFPPSCLPPFIRTLLIRILLSRGHLIGATDTRGTRYSGTRLPQVHTLGNKQTAAPHHHQYYQHPHAISGQREAARSSAAGAKTLYHNGGNQAAGQRHHHNNSYEVSPASFRYYSSSVEYLTGIVELV